jgi:hypothetical protein
MNEINDLTHGRITVRLIADAIELQHHTRQPAHLVAVPGTGRVIAIGTPAEVAQLLAMAPAQLAVGDLIAVECPACDGVAPCDECSGQGKIIVSRADMAAAIQHDRSEGGHYD